MSTALLIVDYQNDFIGGSLAVPEARETHKPILDLAKQDDVEVVVLSRDWHPADHISFSDNPEYKDFSWPPHCVQETAGAQISYPLTLTLAQMDKPVLIATKGDDRDKEAYSAFDGTVPMVSEGVDGGGEPYEYEEPARLSTVLDVGYGIAKVIVVGLALDYCVRASALDSVKNGFQTYVDLSATRPVSYLTGARAIVDLRSAGVALI